MCYVGPYLLSFGSVCIVFVKRDARQTGSERDTARTKAQRATHKNGWYRRGSRLNIGLRPKQRQRCCKQACGDDIKKQNKNRTSDTTKVSSNALHKNDCAINHQSESDTDSSVSVPSVFVTRSGQCPTANTATNSSFAVTHTIAKMKRETEHPHLAAKPLLMAHA